MLCISVAYKLEIKVVKIFKKIGYYRILYGIRKIRPSTKIIENNISSCVNIDFLDNFSNYHLTDTNRQISKKQR